VKEPSVRPESLLITDDEQNIDDNSSLELLDELFLKLRGNAGSNTNRGDTIPNSRMTTTISLKTPVMIPKVYIQFPPNSRISL